MNHALHGGIQGNVASEGFSAAASLPYGHYNSVRVLTALAIVDGDCCPRRRQGKGDGLANSARAASDQSYTVLQIAHTGSTECVFQALSRFMKHFNNIVTDETSMVPTGQCTFPDEILLET
jgi:hypothetical protein